MFLEICYDPEKFAVKLRPRISTLAQIRVVAKEGDGFGAENNDLRVHVRKRVGKSGGCVHLFIRLESRKRATKLFKHVKNFGHDGLRELEGNLACKDSYASPNSYIEDESD